MVNKIRRSILLAGALSPIAPYVFGATNPIIQENSLAGNSKWYIDNFPTWFDWSTDTYGSMPYTEIEGFASAHSVNLGETINFFVNCQEATYTLRVFRMGWYGGAGARLMLEVPLKGASQVIPTPNALGTVDCGNWSVAYSLPIPSTWTSGMYFVKLTTGASVVDSLISFIVRDDARQADFILQSAYNTSQAYNNFGGKSLYEFNSKGGLNAIAISFNRPDMDGGGCGESMSWELEMIRFMEREGYDVKYIANIDVHNNPLILSKGKAFLSVGHDEYWSYEMRQNVQAAQSAGIHMAFLGSNSCYWQVRLNGRVMTCYKENTTADPFYNTDRKRTTIRWRDLPGIGVVDPVAQPENALIGVQYHADPVNKALVISNPGHWMFAGTGVVNGTTFPGLLGYETDTTFNNGFSPPGLIVLFSSPDGYGGSKGAMFIHQSGACVFGAGTMQWSWGCDYLENMAPNSTVNRATPVFQQINRNLLARLLIPALKPPTNIRASNNVLSWDAVTGAATYDIYRATTANVPVTTPYRTGITAPSLAETGLTSGTKYYYKVIARNGPAESASSAEFNFIAGGTGVPTKQDQTINFPAIQAKKVGDPAFPVSATASSSLPITFTSLTPAVVTVSGNMVTVLQAGTATIAANQAGNANWNPAPQVTQSFSVTTSTTTGTPPLAPSRLTGYSCNTGCWAYASQGGAALRINWTQSTSTGITSNTIFRGDGTTGALSQLAIMPAGTTYIDKSAVVGKTYHYRVTATNSGGTSPMSNDTAVAMTA